MLTLVDGLLVLHLVVAGGLMLYGLNCYVLLLLHCRAQKRMLRHDAAVQQRWQVAHPAYPRITVQLPIYNERYVLQRLVEAVVHLDYPRSQLEIQLLDDSTDGTTALAECLAEHYRRAGWAITVLHRTHRQGYKAGALQEGLRQATGEFLAIFDADFVPPPDFCRQLLPFFEEPGIAMVQARWEHINRDYSVLTLAQALGIDGHFWVEQAARCWSGLFLNFNGSGGIWRRVAIEEVGGWHGDTLTEDLDLSYRVQLRGWRLKFVPRVVCPGEIPVQMAGIKSQQRRWAKGSMQTALKLLPYVLRAPVPRFTKMQAVLHLTNYLIHPLMLCTALTTPLLLQAGVVATTSVPALALFGMVCATCGPTSMYLYAQAQLSAKWCYRLRTFPALLVLGTGIALSNTVAIVEAVCGVSSPFVRTPKFRIEGAADTWRGKQYTAPLTWHSLGELALALYSGYGLLLALRQSAYGVAPFLLLYTLGFATVALLSLWDGGTWQRTQRA